MTYSILEMLEEEVVAVSIVFFRPFAICYHFYHSHARFVLFCHSQQYALAVYHRLWRYHSVLCLLYPHRVHQLMFLLDHLQSRL
jgi:hypothetical protein